MEEAWIIELGKAIGRWFLQPVFYWGILIVFLVSLKRIKQERVQLGTKIFDLFSEWRGTWLFNLLAGLILSVGFIVAGVVLPSETLWLFSAIVIVFSLVGKFFWLSPAYTIGFTYLMTLLLPSLSFLPTNWVEAWSNTSLSSLAILLSVLLLVEGLLIAKQKKHATFPQLVRSKRGKMVGQHLVKKAGFIPIFLLIPGGLITEVAPWWPLLSIQGESYGLILMPFFIGFEQAFQGLAPRDGIHRLSRSVILLSVLMMGLAIGSFFLPLLSLITVVAAIVGREVIAFTLKVKDQNKNSYFSSRGNGLPILAVIPNSPADKMLLTVGETIVKVNQHLVTNEIDFYQALQSSSAYCKIELRNEEGELRFAQRAMYEGDHHELGLIFVKEHLHQQVDEVEVS